MSADPPPGHPVRFGKGYAISLAPAPRRGARRRKPITILSHGVVYVPWAGPWAPVRRVWWDEAGETFNTEGRGLPMPGMRTAGAPPALDEQGRLVATISVGGQRRA